ncbi:hypothetical protein D3C75_648640 [compost metagenome]
MRNIRGAANEQVPAEGPQLPHQSKRGFPLISLQQQPFVGEGQLFFPAAVIQLQRHRPVKGSMECCMPLQQFLIPHLRRKLRQLRLQPADLRPPVPLHKNLDQHQHPFRFRKTDKPILRLYPPALRNGPEHCTEVGSVIILGRIPGKPAAVRSRFHRLLQHLELRRIAEAVAGMEHQAKPSGQTAAGSGVPLAVNGVHDNIICPGDKQPPPEAPGAILPAHFHLSGIHPEGAAVAFECLITGHLQPERRQRETRGQPCPVALLLQGIGQQPACLQIPLLIHQPPGIGQYAAHIRQLILLPPVPEGRMIQEHRFLLDTAKHRGSHHAVAGGHRLPPHIAPPGGRIAHVELIGMVRFR